MTPTEQNCVPPYAKEVVPAAQVIINICRGLNFDVVPEGNYEGTNLQGLSGRPVESFSVSELEKIVIFAAGFKRTSEFDRKHFGTLIQDSFSNWSLCQASSERPFDDVITSILTSGKDTVGIRINPAKQGAGDTQPSRPYQKITRLSDPALIRENGQIIGFYRRRNIDGKYDYPYNFTSGDTVELFIDPKPKEINGIKMGGGFVIKITPDNEFEAFITTNGLNVRYVHDSIAADNRVRVTGRLDDDVQNNPILNKFFRQDGHAIINLMKAVNQHYPHSELILQANYAKTKNGLLVYVFDMEIPPKIEAQWRSQSHGPVVPYFDANNPEIAALYLAQINRRFIDRQALND